jgi:hypothetical protein
VKDNGGDENMALTPQTDAYDLKFNNGYSFEKSQPSYTHKMEIEKEKVIGTCDKIEAVKQAVYKILNTDRYAYPIYSHNYGVEINKLFGQPAAYVFPELERMITEGLMQDDRILSVENFSFENKRGNVLCSFTVNCVFGEFRADFEYQYM